MTVYLGSSGRIELTRSSDGQKVEASVGSADVNPQLSAFGLTDINDASTISTGDLVVIRAVGGRMLEWLDPSCWGDNARHPDITAYANVNPAGLIRLYEEFEEAVNDETDKRLTVTPFTGAPIPITLEVASISARCLGQVTRFEFNSERQAVDVSQLGEEFRNNLGTAISGNGTLDAFFSYSRDICDGEQRVRENELSLYMHQLVVRQQLGAAFKASLYVISRGTGADSDDEIWYEINGVITNCGFSMAPGEAVRSTIQFVTTGPIELKVRLVSNYLLQEDASRIALERLQAGYLEVEQTE